MSGGGGTNTVQSSTPWSGIQPYLSNMYANAGQQYAGGGPQVFPTGEVSPLNGMQTTAINNMNNISNGGYGEMNPAQWAALGTTQNMAAGSDPLSQQLMTQAGGGGPAGTALQGILNGSTPATQALTTQATGGTAAEQYLKSTLGSNFTNVSNNPALNNAMNAANYNTTFNYNNAVMPALNSQYSAAGRFGSGAMGTATNMANNTLATQIANSNASMSLADLQQLQQIQSSNAGTLGSQMGTAASSLAGVQNSAAGQLGSQMQGAAGLLNNRQGSALQLLPGMATQGLTNAQAGMTGGTAQQTQSQNELTALINQFNQNQARPYSNLNWYQQMLSGTPWSASSNTSNVANPVTTGVGLGMLGLNAYNAANAGGLLGGGAAAAGGTGAGMFTAGGGALTGAALDSALAASASEGVLAGGAGGSALMGLAAA